MYDDTGRLLSVSSVGEVVASRRISGLSLTGGITRDHNVPSACWLAGSLFGQAVLLQLDASIQDLRQLEVGDGSTYLWSIHSDPEGVVLLGNQLVGTIASDGVLRTFQTDEPLHEAQLSAGAILAKTSQPRLRLYDRANLVVLQEYAVDSRDFVDSPATGEVLSFVEDAAIVFDRSTGLEKRRLAFTDAVNSTTTIEGTALAVGTRDPGYPIQGVVARYDGVLEVEQPTAAGPIDRQVKHSVAMPDGGIALVVASQELGNRASLVRYTATGSLMFTCPIPGDPPGLGLSVAPDNSIVVRTDESNERLLVRISPEGDMIYSKRLPSDLTYSPETESVVALADGSAIVVSGIRTGGMRLQKFDPQGEIKFWREFPLYDGQFVQTDLIARGRLAVLATGSGRPKLLTFSTYTGALQWEVTINELLFNLEMHSTTNGNLLISTGNTVHIRSGDDTSLYLGGRSIDPWPIRVNPTSDGGFAALYISGSSLTLKIYDAQFQLRATALVTEGLAVGVMMDAGPNGSVYISWRDSSDPPTSFAVAKFLSNGARSAYRRLSGMPKALHSDATGVYSVSEVHQRSKGMNPQIALYSH